MPPTAAELLDATNAAILRLLQGHQESMVNGRRYRLPDLAELRKMREGLEHEVAQTASPGMRVRQVVPRG